MTGHRNARLKRPNRRCLDIPAIHRMARVRAARATPMWIALAEATESRAVVATEIPAAALPQRRRFIARRLFLAHLIATRAMAPQTRERRRAEPEEADRRLPQRRIAHRPLKPALLRAFKPELAHQRTPLFTFRSEILHRLRYRRRSNRQQADGGRPLFHVRVGHDPGHFRVQFIENRLRRCCRRKQHVPRHRFKIGCTGGLGEGRHVWECRQPCRRRHR